MVGQREKVEKDGRYCLLSHSLSGGLPDYIKGTEESEPNLYLCLLTPFRDRGRLAQPKQGPK